MIDVSSFQTSADRTRPRISPRHVRGGFSVDEVTLIQQKPLHAVDGRSMHQRVASEDSVMSRGRPKTRKNMSLQRTMNMALQKAPSQDRMVDLPEESDCNQIDSMAPGIDLMSLREIAESHVIGFEILERQQVDKLNEVGFFGR